MGGLSKLFVTTVACLSSISQLTQAFQVIGASEWSAFNDQITGTVILPTDESYNTEYTLWGSTFDYVEPEAIIKCESADDVQQAYRLILSHTDFEEDITQQLFSVRCGKHSFTGVSTTTGIVIDVSGLDQLYLTEDGTAVVGPGVNLSKFTAWAEENNCTLPHGDCASVTFGGFLLGGGIGLTSRTFGMGSDWVKSFETVLANGEIVTATHENEYADLFWATLGGGGNNFGIVTSYEMDIPTKKQVNPGLYVELQWGFSEDNWERVSRVWREFMTNDEYGNHFAMYLRIQPSTYLTQDYYAALHGFWTGEQVDGLMVLADLLQNVGVTPSSAKIDYVHFEGWIESSSAERIRYSSQCKSRWAFDDLSDEFFDRLGGHVQALADYDALDTLLEGDDDESYAYPTQFFFIAPGDGAIAEHDDGSISFPFRDAKYFFALCGRWRDGYKRSESFMKHWITATVDDLEPYLSQYSFVSFPDWDLDDWETSYYRDNYERLQEIKLKYDPMNMFRYAQSIVPKGGDVSMNENYKLPLRNDPSRLSRYAIEEKRIQEEAKQNNNGIGVDLKSITLWSYIIGSIILCGVIYKFFCRGSSQSKKLSNQNGANQYTPLKNQSFYQNEEDAQESEHLVVL